MGRNFNNPPSGQSKLNLGRPRRRVRTSEVAGPSKVTKHVRRSTRKCKSYIEREAREELKRKILNKVEDGLEMVEVEGKGRGVVPTRPFCKDSFLCEYSGKLISHDEAKEKEDGYKLDPSVGCYMYYFRHKDSNWCVDATAESGRLGRLVNHSKTNPNVVSKVVEVDERPYLCLMAARDIKTGEELQYDYGERDKEIVRLMPWLAS